MGRAVGSGFKTATGKLQRWRQRRQKERSAKKGRRETAASSSAVDGGGPATATGGEPHGLFDRTGGDSLGGIVEGATEPAAAAAEEAVSNGGPATTATVEGKAEARGREGRLHRAAEMPHTPSAGSSVDVWAAATAAEPPSEVLPKHPAIGGQTSGFAGKEE